MPCSPPSLLQSDALLEMWSFQLRFSQWHHGLPHHPNVQRRATCHPARHYHYQHPSPVMPYTLLPRSALLPCPAALLTSTHATYIHTSPSILPLNIFFLHTLFRSWTAGNNENEFTAQQQANCHELVFSPLSSSTELESSIHSPSLFFFLAAPGIWRGVVVLSTQTPRRPDG